METRKDGNQRGQRDGAEPEQSWYRHSDRKEEDETAELVQWEARVHGCTSLGQQMLLDSDGQIITIVTDRALGEY